MFTWVRASGTAPTVTISENALTLNSAAASYFQDIRYVMIGIDAEAKQLAIRGVSKKQLDLQLVSRDSLYKLSVGKGYARITSKIVIQKINESFHHTFVNEKVDACYSDTENMLIADIAKRGGGET